MHADSENLVLTDNDSAATYWVATGQHRTNDPRQATLVGFGAASVAPQTGHVHLEHPLDFRRSVPTPVALVPNALAHRTVLGFAQLPAGANYASPVRDPVTGTLDRWDAVLGPPALVYNSETVTVKPILEATLTSDPGGAASRRGEHGARAARTAQPLSSRRPRRRAPPRPRAIVPARPALRPSGCGSS